MGAGKGKAKFKIFDMAKFIPRHYIIVPIRWPICCLPTLFSINLLGLSVGPTTALTSMYTRGQILHTLKLQLTLKNQISAHRSLTFFDGFTFTADLRFFFSHQKIRWNFPIPFFCRWKEISKNVADILYFLNNPCFVALWKCYHK